MHLSSRQAIELDERGLLAFLQFKIKEGLHLDYKADLSGNKKERYREFLKDVTAFANAQGGDILIGVKEPSDDLENAQQIVGIERGDSIAQDLERLARASIDAPIPGLIVRPLSLSNGLFVILAHVPPSLSRPHMVVHEGHRSFYIRHWESSFPMTTSQIKESVIATLSAEARVREYFKQREEQVLRYEITGPTLFIQAMPLIALEDPWPVLDESIKDIIRGAARRRKYGGYVDLASDIMPTPIIDGIMGRESRTNNSWVTEVHRNGYASALFRCIQTTSEFEFPQYRQSESGATKVHAPLLHSGHCQLFQAFCGLLGELWASTGVDLPYVVGCTYFKAKDTVFLIEVRPWRDLSESCTKDELRFPYHYRQIGEDPAEIAEMLCQELFNAFGAEKKSSPK